MAVKEKASVAFAAVVLMISVPAQAAETPSHPSAVRVTVDPRVELLSIIFHLAGSHEYNQQHMESYVKDVDAYFAPYLNHPVVELAKKLRQSRGISFDAPMRMAVHLTDVEMLETRTPLEPWPDSLDRRWTEADAEEFLLRARQFVSDSSYQEFFDHHRPLYNVAEERVSSLLQSRFHLEWFDDFFGTRPAAKFTVAIGMLNGGCNYGVNCRADAEDDLYCVLGVWETDAQGLPQFSDGVLPTIIHEFCHSYTNEFVDRHLSELQGAGEQLFAPVAANMQSQGYYDARSLLYESMVRACVVRYVRKHDGPQAAHDQLQEEHRRGFSWVEPLSDLLAEYESQRERYPALEDFSPQVIRFFNDVAEAFDKEHRQRLENDEKILAEAMALVEKAPRSDLKTLDGNPPQIVSMSPADGDRVDPDLKAIVVVFDRPMRDNNWAFYEGPDAPCPPVVAKCAFDSSHSIWVRPVKLEPDSEYSFLLNHKDMLIFQSQDGVPLAPVHITFKTAGRSVERPGAAP